MQWLGFESHLRELTSTKLCCTVFVQDIAMYMYFPGKELVLHADSAHYLWVFSMTLIIPIHLTTLPNLPLLPSPAHAPPTTCCASAVSSPCQIAERRPVKPSLHRNVWIAIHRLPVCVFLSVSLNAIYIRVSHSQKEGGKSEKVWNVPVGSHQDRTWVPSIFTAIYAILAAYSK